MTDAAIGNKGSHGSLSVQLMMGILLAHDVSSYILRNCGGRLGQGIGGWPVSSC